MRDLSPSRAALGVVALVLALAACGSNLQPTDLVGAGGTTGGSDAEAATSGGELTSVDPGTGVVDPGVGVVDAGAPLGDTDAGAVADTGGGGSSTGTTAGGAPAAAGGDAPAASSAKGTKKSADKAKPATGDAVGVSCDGFKNGPGVTDSTITIGNSSDVSGPVPGLFQAAQQATQAYVAYFNATSTICGRKLALKLYDSRTDAGADQQGYTQGCSDTFAMVGSMSAFDSGGASTAQSCGLPDVRAISVTADRYSCSTCYAAQSAQPNAFENVPMDFLLSQGVTKSAMLYIDAGAASENGRNQAAVGQKHGLNYVYTAGIPVSEFNYTPYVQKMKSLGVESVQFVAEVPQFVRLAQAMKAQGFTPKAYLLDPTAYRPELAANGGSDVDGTYVFTNFTPFEEAASSPEMKLYLSWLQQASPGARPTFFGVFAWSAARLFTEQAAALGGQLSRPTLLAALSKVDNWTDNGLHAPQHVGPRANGDCWRILQLKGSTWGSVGTNKYTCSGVTQ